MSPRPRADRELQPPESTRIVMTVMGLVLLTLGLGAAILGEDADSHVGGIVIALVGLPLALRSWTTRLTLTEDRAVVRGLAWTTTVPRASVTKVTDFPALRWTDRRGLPRWTPLWAFSRNDRVSNRTTDRTNADCVNRLRQWAPKDAR